MLAYLIYERTEGEKNKGFIEMFQKEGAQYGISFLFVAKEEYQGKKLPELVLNRTRDYRVSLWYEERGIPVLHGSKLVELGNDKWKTFLHLKEYFKKQKSVFSFGKEEQKGRFSCEDRKILPDTLYFPKLGAGEFYQRVVKEGWHKGENLVLKTVDGHGGNEVFLIPAADLERDAFLGEQTFLGEPHFLGEIAFFGEVEAFKESGFWKERFEGLSGKRCIIQEQIKSRSQDVRVYVVGNEIYHAVLRTGVKDFRSNFSLGGSVREYVLSEEEKNLVFTLLKAWKGLTLGLVGLDFIVAEDGGFIFNELEEMAGCRMLYACTERDIVKDYVRWLAAQRTQVTIHANV